MEIKSFRINGKVHYGLPDYRRTPPTTLPTATGVVHSHNHGTLVLSGFRNLNLDKIRINEGSQIDVGDDCLYVLAINNQTEDEIVLMVTDCESML